MANQTELDKLWKRNVFNALKDLSDIEFQKSAWMGNNPRVVSSYDEICCVLFDDSCFEDYINHYKATKGEDKLYILFTELRDMMDEYISPGKDALVLRDPSWHMIVEKAKEVMISLSEQKKST